MSVALTWFQLTWPRRVDVDHLVEALLRLAVSRTVPIALEAVGTQGQITHRLGLPSGATMLIDQLRDAVHGLGLDALDEREPLELNRAVELRLSTPHRPLRFDAAEQIAHGLLVALAAARSGERVVLQWQLLNARAPVPVSTREKQPHSDSWLKDLKVAASTGQHQLEGEARQALRTKRSLVGWRLVGRIGAKASNPGRQRQLIHHLVDCLRSAEAPGAQISARATKPSSLDELRKPWKVPLRLNVAELASVAAWPIGDTRALHVRHQASRVLPPARALVRDERVIGTATYPGRERPVGLAVKDAMRGTHLIGPTGTGKSTLLLNLIVQDMAAGRSTIVLEPKGDLISDILTRIPEHRLDDVVLIDPTDPDAVVGINPFAASGTSAELVADQLYAVVHKLYEQNWGPRTGDILHAALLTLAMTPKVSLAALPLLLSEPGFRRKIVGRIDEPLVLQPFWSSFENWSTGEQAAATAPVQNKLRPLLIRPSLRAVLGQAEPRFSLRDVFKQKRIVLVNLAKGLLGPEGSALLGAIIVSQLWSIALERAAVPSEQRFPVITYIDEFQDFVGAATDLGDALAQARGLGVGLVLAHQHLGQLNPSMRAALANARSRVVFQLGSDDAKTLTAGDALLEADDVSSLGAFEVYARFVANDAVQPWVSLKTHPAPEPTSDPDEVRARSRERYAVPVALIDEQIKALRTPGNERSDLEPMKRTRGANP